MLDLTKGNAPKIITNAKNAGFIIPQIAYTLATSHWETNATHEPVEEAYYLGGRAEAYRRTLRYFPWHGRGNVQLTWEENYLKASKEIGVDLIANRELAMDPDVSAAVIVCGMRYGWFTGRKLSDYITETKRDFRNARRIINGMDKASQIAALADEYFDALAPKPAYPYLRIGSRGASVTTLQKALVRNGARIVIDGIFGNGTDAALRRHQTAHKLTVDGIAGPQVWASLEGMTQ